MSTPKRPRAERRLLERSLRKEVREREALVLEAPGGRPERAITLTTVATIEGIARSTPCHQCAGSLDVLEHTAERVANDLLRLVKLRCRQCHTPRALWFRIAPPLAH